MSQCSRGKLVGVKVGVKGFLMGCSYVDVQKSVRGWWCEMWGEEGVDCTSPPKLMGYSGGKKRVVR